MHAHTFVVKFLTIITKNSGSQMLHVTSRCCLKQNNSYQEIGYESPSEKVQMSSLRNFIFLKGIVEPTINSHWNQGTNVIIESQSKFSEFSKMPRPEGIGDGVANHINVSGNTKNGHFKKRKRVNELVRSVNCSKRQCASTKNSSADQKPASVHKQNNRNENGNQKQRAKNNGKYKNVQGVNSGSKTKGKRKGKRSVKPSRHKITPIRVVTSDYDIINGKPRYRRNAKDSQPANEHVSKCVKGRRKIVFGLAHVCGTITSPMTKIYYEDRANRQNKNTTNSSIYHRCTFYDCMAIPGSGIVVPRKKDVKAYQRNHNETFHSNAERAFRCPHCGLTFLHKHIFHDHVVAHLFPTIVPNKPNSMHRDLSINRRHLQREFVATNAMQQNVDRLKMTQRYEEERLNSFL